MKRIVCVAVAAVLAGAVAENVQLNPGTYRAAPEGFPGAVLVTADADGAPHFDCVGEAAPGRRMEPDTVFWMASNTKGVLAALVLNLVSEGKLSLDDPVEKYFPSWKKLPVKTRPTLRMLLCHTSGLDVFPKKAIARPGMEALAEHVHVEPLKFEPDTKYLYSNWDIDVAAAIVEKVTGRPFDVEMAERIFKPLGMTDSTFIPNASQNARRATFYKLSDKRPPMPTKIVRGKLAPPYMEVGVHPEAGGGLLSTPRDMIKFFQMIARGGLTPDGRRLISAPLMEKWAAKQTPKCVKVSYSFGMKVDGKGSLSHGGAGGTWAEANVKTRKARLYMVNVQGSSKVAKSFRDDWMKKTELAPARAVVTEAGADPTGKTDSTAAIQKCIDRVSAAGGGTVVVPPGEYRILYLSLRPHVRLELAGGVERATDGWTPEVAARAMDPARSAIIRSAANRKGHWSIFLYNLVPRTDATNGVSDVAVSGGVFDCQGRYVPAAFACGRNIRFENAVVKDIPNNHALQIDGCENVVVTNCLFAGYTFGGTQTCLTRETIQVEQTSPGAIGNPETSPISCAKEISIPNRNVSVTGCWFGPSERLGPHLVALGHHGRARSCNGLVFSGNVVVNPLYCGVRLANVSDVRVENNTFISTNATKRLADDSAMVCLWGGATLKPGEKGVVLRGNKIVLSEKSPLRRLWTTKARQKEVTAHDFADAPMRYTPVPGGYKANNGETTLERDFKPGETIVLNPSEPAVGKYDPFGGGVQSAEIYVDGRKGSPEAAILPDGTVTLQSTGAVSKIELVWKCDLSWVEKTFAGDWERCYGFAGWRKMDPAYPAPWYCLATGGGRTDGYGVMVQPAAFATWKLSSGSVRLILDVRAGRKPVRLGGRRLELCRVVSRRGVEGEGPFEAGRAFCKMMCPSPRLPKAPVYGYNDWYCAYGRNTATNFLSDAAEIVALCDGLANRPFVVVDDGWQSSDFRGGKVRSEAQWSVHNANWGMPMDEFCRRVKAMGARPGLWYRPFYADKRTERNGIDPANPRWSAQIAADMKRFREWGIELVKIDYITYDWSPRWNFRPQESVLDAVKIDWSDDTRTAAETVRDLYRAMRTGAGDGICIIGCNAIDHFAAGLFELQRIGDDTSGKDWSRTLKMGPNAVAMRAIHNNIFYFNDGDCVGLATKGAVPWDKNAQWLDLVARSGTSLFVSWRRELLDADVRKALRDAFRMASRPQETGEPLDWTERLTPARWKFERGVEKTYDW